ncbi:hypothetical protein HMPREF1544_03486 [Mucor circinelloides 1006PhL]|uniref:Uncharacterized protein n=1 Tax=Mucor circinelloides f. circinelloides (strain 1006PhL) TaxID=1220926 RepID=S2JH79_MUCC1|nr:hypothetical protein HMPREF1544_03486 [Mucor circinelloides 1006PhL]
MTKYILHFMRIRRRNRNCLQQLESGAPLLIVRNSDVPDLLNPNCNSNMLSKSRIKPIYSEIIKHRSYKATATCGYRQIDFSLF